MLARAEEIIAACRTFENKYKELLLKVHPENKASAKNLIHYLAYRSLNTKKLYSFLNANGLGAFKDIEDNVMGNLTLIRQLLYILAGKNKTVLHKNRVFPSIESNAYQEKLNLLFGDKDNKGRSTRIMVTQPSLAAHRPSLMEEMMDCGMNCIRINCAHDNQNEWEKMICHSKRIATKKKRNIAITMDLAGPKIRTGSIAPGPKVLHLAPKKDAQGIAKKAVRLGLLPLSAPYPNSDKDYMHIPLAMFLKLVPGDEIVCRDNAGKEIKFNVIDVHEEIKWATCHSSAYLRPGLSLTLLKDTSTYLLGDIPPIQEHLLLKKGDLLNITSKMIDGSPAKYGKQGKLLRPAQIPCTSQEVFKDVRSGQSIVFDDGKISGIIRKNCIDHLQIEITKAKPDGSKLKSDKGINFPESKLKLSGLTPKDKADLKFVARHADVVNMSFVNTPDDVRELFDELKMAGVFNEMAAVLKIETLQGLDNIAAILLTGMQTRTMGIMIARGDLAIECGWEKIGIVQQELLKICRAAHTPVVWATQVLEQLTKKGVPSRAEITDAIMGQKADCIMLNKGDHITGAIHLLDRILVNLETVKEDHRIFKIS